jgi:acyl-CoA thioesterase
VTFEIVGPGRPIVVEMTGIDETTGDDEPGDGAASEYGDFPLKRFLGMELTGDEPGVGIARLAVGDRHLNPNGVVHGAVLFALVDTAMGKSTMSVIDEPGRFCASIELSLRFIRPAVGGELRAVAHVVKRGRHVVHLTADVVGNDDRLIASAAGTFAIIDP